MDGWVSVDYRMEIHKYIIRVAFVVSYSEISWEAGRVLKLSKGLSGVREGQEVGGVAKRAAGKRSSWMETKKGQGIFRNWACPKCQLTKSFKENLF